MASDDFEEEISLSELLSDYADTSLGRAKSSSVAKVLKYDITKQRVKAQPVVRRVRATVGDDEEGELPPPVLNVPVYTSGGGGFMCHFPVAKKDQCLLVSVAESTDEWVKKDSDDIEPLSKKRMRHGDQVAFVGIRSDDRVIKDLPANACAFGSQKSGEMRLVMEKKKVSIGTSTTDLVVELRKTQELLKEFMSIVATMSTAINATAPNTAALELVAPILALTAAISKIKAIER